MAADTITTNSLVAGLCLGFLLLVLPRRYALLPILVAGCYMTLGQALIVGGLHLYLIRILILFGMVRIVARRELFRISPHPIDRVLIAWLAVSSFLYVLVDGRYVSLTERLGDAYTAVGIYLLVRALVKDFDDAVLAVKMCAIIIIPLSVLFVVENVTGQNPFAVLGGVPLFSYVREGRVRCQGPFKHAILAGTFGATAMPLFVGLFAYTRNRVLAIGAIAAATVIVVASASSGAFTAFFLSIVGLIAWSLKSHMRSVRWGIVLLVLALNIYMKAPLWFVIDRLSGLVGGDGWYRSALIDEAISHFSEWWLIGTGYTVHWMPTGIASNPYSADIVNEFVNQGARGGLLALLLFIWLIVKCFKATGTAVRDQQRYLSPDRFMIWSMGCAILGHVGSFFSVSYFDQITIFWYLSIGMIAALVHVRNGTHTEPKTASIEVSSLGNPALNPKFAHFRARPSAAWKAGRT